MVIILKSVFLKIKNKNFNLQDLQEIPESIKYCQNIQVMDLSNNPLQL